MRLRKQFEPLPESAFVFRLAETNSMFIPEGARLPNAELFTPSSKDKEEAKKRGRPPGVSVWDRDLTTVEQARTIRYWPNEPPDGIRAFSLNVGFVRGVGKQFDRQIDVVADPESQEKGPGASGHSLIEGLKRPPDQSRKLFKDIWATLAGACKDITPAG